MYAAVLEHSFTFLLFVLLLFVLLFVVALRRPPLRTEPGARRHTLRMAGSVASFVAELIHADFKQAVAVGRLQLSISTAD